MKINFDKRNYRKHNDKNKELINKSLKECGAGRSIVIDNENNIIAGNGIYEQSQKLGLKTKIIETDGSELVVVKRTDLQTDDDKRKQLAVMDNSTSDSSEFDFELLQEDFDTEELEDWGLNVDFAIEEEEKEVIEDEVPEEVETRCKLGDIWQLDNHRLMCGDSTSVTDIEKLMNGNKADMVFTDPPYGMKKEKEGVLNDNLNYDDLLDFNKKWMPLAIDNLKDTGCLYCWGIDEPLMDIYSNILKPLKQKNKIVIRNYITWAKHAAFGINSSLCLSYPKETEKCWFIMKGQDWNNNNAEFFNTKFTRILEYMQEQAKNAGLDATKLKEICGCQMWSHWFSKSQFTIISEKHYKELQQACTGHFLKPYSELRDLIGESNDPTACLKPYFDSISIDEVGGIGLTDVWRFPITSNKEREGLGHATPKPIALCSRAIHASSREKENVLDLFGGSGSTLIACEQLNRKCFMMELDEHYCDVIIQRWENLTGKKAELCS